MGLTVNRQTAKKSTVNRQKRNIFTVNRQMSEPKLAVKFLLAKLNVEGHTFPRWSASVNNAKWFSINYTP